MFSYRLPGSLLESRPGSLLASAEVLDDPDLIQAEIDRRQATARNADPLRRRQEELRREQLRIEKNSERLLTAYQEGLVTFPQLRQRMPVLQKQAQAVGSELQSLEMAAVDEARYLQLAESLGGFRSKLRVRADTLDVAVRQQILRLIVKEVWSADTITLRHSIPTPQSGQGQTDLRFRLPVSPDQSRAQVIFCVRGVTTAPCGVPIVVSDH